MIRAALLILLLLSVAQTATPRHRTAEPPRFRTHHARLGISYEELSIPGDETMGLLGAGLQARAWDDWYLGLASYGAARGRRGGFFTGGFAAAWRPPVGENWELDVGGFAGGGGGGSAPQGGGLMLRLQASLARPTSFGTFSAGWSRVEFPNGDIASNQWTLGYARPLRMILRAGWGGHDPVDLETDLRGRYHRPHRQRIQARLIQAWPTSGTRDVAGRPHTAGRTLVGAAWETALAEQGFLVISTTGAAGGEADGYAQVVVEMGQRLPLGDGIAVVYGTGAGLGGGGRVRVGGGVLGRVFAGLEQRLGRGFHLELGGGLTSALDGDDTTRDLRLTVARSYWTPVTTGGWRVPGSAYYMPRDFRLRAVHQWECHPCGGGHRHADTVGLTGIAADLRLHGAFHLSGQALAAYDGGAGGYAEGLFGLGATWPLGLGLDLELETALGAAGGGGVDVGGGLIGQAVATVGAPLNRALGVRAGYGRMGPLKSGLDRDVFRLELALRFSLLTR